MKISIGHSSTSATLFNEKSSEATRLNCGFNCLEKCHLCNASDWHVVTADAEWRGTVGNRRIGEPFKPGPNPMLTIPGLERDSILPDSCHCCHLGWGIDFAASGLVLLCKRMYFNNGTLNQALHYAYKKFLKWCDANGKTTGIDWWSVKKLDMKTSLELSFSLPRFSV